MHNFRHKNYQPNFLNLENSTLFVSETTLQFLHTNTSKSLLRSFRKYLCLDIKQRSFDVSCSNLPFVVLSSKYLLAFIPLFLLPYSFKTQALSATTANSIQGTAPYLTFDGGATKVTTTDGFLWIKLSDGSTPAPNSTTSITLPAAGETFADIEMLVPVTAPPVSATDPMQKINLNDLIGPPYNYWGDDDGDGQGASAITATGSLSVVITDKNGIKMNRSDTASICGAPYKVVLTATAGSLTTQYGEPSSSAFTAASATYLINPVASPAVCFAKPFSMHYATGQFAGPAGMWNGGTVDGTIGSQSNGKGFITQSITPITYSNNFPTTGANGLHFDLDIGGLETALTWDPITVNGITATMTAATPTSVTVTLTGPTDTTNPKFPFGTFSTTGATFELEGKSSNATVVKYGFTIKKWYVNRGTTTATAAAQGNWCTRLGYRQPKVNDLTNASGGTWTGALPGSGGNNYSRYIGTGLFSEWGNMLSYIDAGFLFFNYWTSDAADTGQFSVHSGSGNVFNFNPSYGFYAVCVYP